MKTLVGEDLCGMSDYCRAGDKNSKGPTWRALKPNENHLKSTLCFGGRN